MSAPLYEIFALRYAHLAERNQGSNLIFPDDHEAPMPLDFFVWVIKGNGRVIMLDTGFDAESAARRNRSWIRSPIAALSSIGVKPEDVQDVVLSHLHWDHVQGLPFFIRERIPVALLLDTVLKAHRCLSHWFRARVRQNVGDAWRHCPARQKGSVCG